MSVNEYLNDIRHVIEQNRSKAAYAGKLIAHQVGIDEVFDHALISFRLYKSDKYTDVVRVAAGVSFSYEKLPESFILLPSLSEIIKLRKKHGLGRI